MELKSIERELIWGGGGPPPPPLELIRGDMLGMVLECHEGRSVTSYDRLSLLKDCHVLVVHNFIETGNAHERKCNRHFRKLLARLRDIHSKDHDTLARLVLLFIRKY